MRFLRLFKFDIRNGVVRFWYRYAIVLVFFVLSAVPLWSMSEFYGMSAESLTYGDYLVHAFAGMKEYVYDPRNPFNFPALWMLAFLLVAYLTLSYPYGDLMGSGRHELVGAGSRSTWWCSKCCWVVVSVLLFYAVAALGIALFVAISGGVFSLSLSAELPSALDFGNDWLAGPWDSAGLFFLFPSMTVALCLLQLMISLAAKPIPSFLCTIALLFFSAYFKSPFLPGNYLMAARSEVFIVSGMPIMGGFVAALIIAIFSILCGKLIFRKMDIMEKE